MTAFPRTPINIEIKGRTKAEADGGVRRNAEALAGAARQDASGAT